MCINALTPGERGKRFYIPLSSNIKKNKRRTKTREVMASSESTANAFELEYINEIKVKYANGDRNILHTPPSFLGGRPRLPTFYAKDVTVCCPLKQFAISLFCPSCETGNLAIKGWADPRRLQNLHGSGFLLQSTYRCTNTSCRKTIAAGTLLEQSKTIPDYVKISYPFILKEKSALGQDLLTMITSNSTTGMTFEEISAVITTNRSSRYFNKRTVFYAAKAAYEDEEKKKYIFGSSSLIG